MTSYQGFDGPAFKPIDVSTARLDLRKDVLKPAMVRTSVEMRQRRVLPVACVVLLAVGMMMAALFAVCSFNGLPVALAGSQHADASAAQAAEPVEPTATLTEVSFEGDTCRVGVALAGFSVERVTLDISLLAEDGDTLASGIPGASLARALAYRVDTSSGKASVVATLPVSRDAQSAARMVLVRARGNVRLVYDEEESSAYVANALEARAS